jgi:hypothetical protein
MDDLFGRLLSLGTINALGAAAAQAGATLFAEARTPRNSIVFPVHLYTGRRYKTSQLPRFSS